MNKVLIVGDDITNVPSNTGAIVVATNDVWKNYRRWKYLVYSPNYYDRANVESRNFINGKRVIGPEMYQGSNQFGNYNGKDPLLIALYWTLVHISTATIGVLGFENNKYKDQHLTGIKDKTLAEYSVVYNLSNNLTLPFELMDLETFTELKV